MKQFKKFLKFCTDTKYRFRVLGALGLYKHWPDEKYLKRRFEMLLGYPLDLKNLRTFTEKLQWLKLYDRKSIYTTMVDKYEAKKYVADVIGEKYIIPTLGVWDKFEDIDFEKLPNQFVLKCTHDSGGLVICRDKSKLDYRAAKKKLNRSLKRNYFWSAREWPYKDVKPRIIAEQYMKDDTSDDLKDYKFFCFNGEPRYCQVITDRSTDERVDFFDMEWNPQPFTGLTRAFAHAEREPVCPGCFEEMKASCRALSKGISFVRVDFYHINGAMFFGEMTFFPVGGFGRFYPNEWNQKIGDWLVLPIKK